MSAVAEGSQLRSRPTVVAVTVLVAVLVNLAVHAVGRAAGGAFTFTRQGSPVQVDAVTVAGFSAVPLLVGMVLAAAAARRLPVLMTVGLIVAPALALVTVPVMTLPADFDRISTLTLALCHVTLAPVSVLGLLALRRAVAEENR